jgi:hypothetical protein
VTQTKIMMKNAGFLDVTPCVSGKNRLFGTAYRLHHQGGKNGELADSCHPDDGGDTFPRNVGSYKSHKRNIPEDRILHSHRRQNLKSYIALTG